MCGEQHHSEHLQPEQKGSPPRVRGTECHIVAPVVLHRITPACAGNSSFRLPRFCRNWDHPRVCGEQQGIGVGKRLLTGSPPRVRGTGYIRQIQKRFSRITPACAGNSTTPGIYSLNRKDHPRVCGEQSIPFNYERGRMGSPPRVRGTVATCDKDCVSAGITPACAGNSRLQHGKCCFGEDHPRVCGEQRCGGWRFRVKGGSPPRVRGTGSFYLLYTITGGITPACAGNRLKKARHFYILFCQIKRIHLV